MLAYLLKISVIAVIAAFITVAVMKYFFEDVEPGVVGGVVGGVSAAAASSLAGRKKSE